MEIARLSTPAISQINMIIKFHSGAYTVITNLRLQKKTRDGTQGKTGIEYTFNKKQNFKY